MLEEYKEHNIVFLNVPVVWFKNGRSLLGYLVRAKVSKLEESGRYELYEKNHCFVCGSISITTTLTTETWQETFETQKGPLNCDFKKALHLVKYKLCDEFPDAGKGKTKFRYRYDKRKHRTFRKENQKVPRKRFHNHCCLNVHG